jgi:hypothetical protein
MCPLRPASLTPRDGRPKVLQPRKNPPGPAARPRSPSPPDVGARYRQDLPHGSPARHARYATLRNTIQGLNGYAKDPAHQALAAPGRRRVRGTAPCSLFTALLLTAANIRKIRACRALPPAPAPPPTSGHADAGPASATTPQTADSPRTQRHRPAPPARQQPRPPRPERNNPAPAARKTAPGRRPQPISDTAGTIRNGHQSSSVGMTLRRHPGRHGDLDQAVEHGIAAFSYDRKTKASLLSHAADLDRLLSERYPGEHLADEFHEHYRDAQRALRDKAHPDA